jgi:3-oxoacyl-[acyl-carrier protein] reductase
MERMLRNKVAVITGSGRGIGQATAFLFAQEGAKVVVSDIDREPAEETVSQIKKEGGEALSFVGDVTAPDFAQGLVDTAIGKWNALHIIINNAGFTWDALIHKMTDEQWETLLDLHLQAPFRILRAARPYFCESAKMEMDKGKAIARKIVNVSSIAGLGGNFGQANYASAKAGIVGLTKTISKEWARYNVQANVVAFGFIDTRLTQDKEKGITVESRGKRIEVGVPAKQRQIFAQMIPMGRAGTVGEAAGAILFLASPLSDYVSGQVLVVGGGFSM